LIIELVVGTEIEPGPKERAPALDKSLPDIVHVAPTATAPAVEIIFPCIIVLAPKPIAPSATQKILLETAPFINVTVTPAPVLNAAGVLITNTGFVIRL
jgi:hypothetical protein